jgi:omega-amidase
MKSFRIAVCQMMVVDDKNANLRKAVSLIEKSAAGGADLIILPEMFNCPYDTEKFPEYAEDRKDSITLSTVSRAARKYGVHLIAGSIPESGGVNVYNTSFIFNPKGDLMGAYRKLHLFDIDVPHGITFKESDTLTAGKEITVLETELCKLGVAICYDIRFPELLRIMALEGSELVVVPGAFNMTTGPSHWEPLIRSRAMDNQIFLAAASPARDENASYVAYGHSMVVDPWGDVLARAGIDEEIIYADLKSSRIEEVRSHLPLLKNRRLDLYDLIKK